MATTHPTLREPTTRAGGDPVLDELLDRELAYDPLARGGFNSHLSMSLVAARRLGATDDQLREWFEAQTTDGFLVPRDRPSRLDRDTAEVERLGIDAVVRRELPALVDAPLSQFFHAIIRLELAIDAQHAGQVANALQHLREQGRPLGDPPGGDGGESLAAVASALAQHPQRRSGSLRDLRGAAEAPWFRDTLARLRDDGHLLDDVAAFVAAVHLDRNDFTSLHMVTGTRAARALAQYLDPEDQRRLALRTAQAVALVAAVVLDGADPSRRDTPDVDASRLAWADIGRAALVTLDPHVVKLVYAARLEEAATADPRYRFLAARQAGLAY